MLNEIILKGRENIRVAGLQRLEDGSRWIQCPFCGKRSVPITKDTEVFDLFLKCRGSNCKQVYRVDIHQSPRAAAFNERRGRMAQNGK